MRSTLEHVAVLFFESSQIVVFFSLRVFLEALERVETLESLQLLEVVASLEGKRYWKDRLVSRKAWLLLRNNCQVATRRPAAGASSIKPLGFAWHREVLQWICLHYVAETNASPRNFRVKAGVAARLVH